MFHLDICPHQNINKQNMMVRICRSGLMVSMLVGCGCVSLWGHTPWKKHMSGPELDF